MTLLCQAVPVSVTTSFGVTSRKEFVNVVKDSTPIKTVASAWSGTSGLWQFDVIQSPYWPEKAGNAIVACHGNSFSHALFRPCPSLRLHGSAMPCTYTA